jgi:hypothetical protein
MSKPASEEESRPEMARRTRLLRNTVKKWLRSGECVEPLYGRGVKGVVTVRRCQGC